MTACIITHSGGSFITLEQGTFVLCDTGMNVVFIYFLSHSNHLISFIFMLQIVYFELLHFYQELRVEVRMNALPILKSFFRHHK